MSLSGQQTIGKRQQVSFRKYGLIAIPVVDQEGYIVGIVTFDDAMDVSTEETTEDIHKMAAISSSEELYFEDIRFRPCQTADYVAVDFDVLSNGNGSDYYKV